MKIYVKDVHSEEEDNAIGQEINVEHEVEVERRKTWLRKISLLNHQLLLMRRSKKKNKKLFKFPKKRKASKRSLNIKKLMYKRIFPNRKMLLNKKRFLKTRQEKCGASVREDENFMYKIVTMN